MSSQRKLSNFFRTTADAGDISLEASGSQAVDHAAVLSVMPEIDQDDFGRAVEKGRARIPSDEKARWLERDHSWRPARTFDWPFQLRKRNGVDEKRFLKPEDLEREEAQWISYSQLKKGLFCRACFFFSTVRNAAFVDKPYNRYGYLWGRENGITHHIAREYHVQAVDSAQLFLKPVGHIDRNFNETDRRVNDAGNHVMKPKIEAAILLSKLGLPFRGHRDAGEIQVIKHISDFTGEEGCFRALLQFGAMKSSAEKEALEEANRLSGYASYFSPDVQNQLIQCIGDVIRAKIVKDVCKTYRTVVETAFEVVQPVIEFYIETDFIQSTVAEIQSQFEAWKTRCELLDETQRKLGVKEALKLSNRESTKLIHRLLLAYAAIPLSSATCERSFSGLKRIKTWLRSRTGEERLDGLAVAHLNKSTSVSFEEVKALFDSKQQRRYNRPPAKKQRRAFPVEKDDGADMSSDSDSPFVAFDDESDAE